MDQIPSYANLNESNSILNAFKTKDYTSPLKIRSESLTQCITQYLSGIYQPEKKKLLNRLFKIS